MSGSLFHVETDKVVVPASKLRDIQSDDPDYYDLLMSIDRWGVLEPIIVRKGEGDEYILIDGLQRFSCAKKLGHPTVPAHDVAVSDSEEALLLSCIANLHTVKTPAYQYAHALRRIIRKREDLTLEKLAELLGKSEAWVKERLSLIKLVPEIGEMVDNGELSLKAASGLSLLDANDQRALVPQASVMSGTEFFKTCVAFHRDQMRLGHVKKEREAPIVRLHPVLRNIGALKNELLTGAAFYQLVNRGLSPDSKQEAFNLALNWVMQMDPISFETRKAKAVKKIDQIQKRRDQALNKKDQNDEHADSEERNEPDSE